MWPFWDTLEKDKGSEGIAVEALTGVAEVGLKAKEISRDIASFSGSLRWHVYIFTTTSLTRKSAIILGIQIPFQIGFIVIVTTVVL